MMAFDRKKIKDKRNNFFQLENLISDEVSPFVRHCNTFVFDKTEPHPHLGRDILGSSCHTFSFHNCMDAFFQTLGWSFNTFQAKAFLNGVGTLIHQLILPGI